MQICDDEVERKSGLRLAIEHRKGLLALADSH